MTESEDRFYNFTSFILTKILAPVLLFFALSPTLIDTVAPDLEPNRKFTLQILCYAAVFMLMMKSRTSAIILFGWTIIIVVVVAAYELNKLLP